MLRYFLFRSTLVLGVIIAAYYSESLPADVIFEGYYKIKLADKHAGYAIQRYEFDAKKKQFRSTYFIQTNQLLGSLQESLKAVASEKFEPVSYQYTTKVGEAVKIIDAKFQKNMMLAKVSDGKVSNNISEQMPKGVFLSTFLGYVMLNKGYSIDKKYTYKAIAEEDAKLLKGTAFIKEEVQHSGMSVYRILNEFKNSRFVSLVSKNGEVLSTAAPTQRISTQLVKSPAQATKGLTLPQKSLKILFGKIPTGGINSLRQAKAASSKAGSSQAASDKATSSKTDSGKEEKPSN